jgi:flavin reductase (DIM6/NTAB) family NADH-FMN oxidoreductase RutF
MDPARTYELLRNLTSPVVAITATRGAKSNGMISDSAVRASIVPTLPRLSVFIHKFNFTHDMIFESGAFVLHLLRRDQFELVHQLGFQSGRNQDKLARVPHHVGKLGAPVLDQCYAHFECRVVNVMDTGSSTCFLGDVVEVGFGSAPASEAQGEVMTAAYFRGNMPPEWRRRYEEHLHEAQRFAAERSRDIRPVVWRELERPHQSRP